MVYNCSTNLVFFQILNDLSLYTLLVQDLSSICHFKQVSVAVSVCELVDISVQSIPYCCLVIVTLFCF